MIAAVLILVVVAGASGWLSYQATVETRRLRSTLEAQDLALRLDLSNKLASAWKQERRMANDRAELQDRNVAAVAGEFRDVRDQLAKHGLIKVAK